MKAPVPWRYKLFGRFDRLQYLSGHKLANLLLNKGEQLFSRKVLLSKPARIAISVAGVCGSTCQLCPIGLGYRSEDRGLMSLEDFKAVIAPLRRKLLTVSLVGWGEPLVNPLVYKMLRHLKQQNIRSVVYSNLQSSGPIDAEALVKSGLSRLDVSLHGLTPDTYQSYQPGKFLGPVLSTIRDIQDAKVRLASKSPEISITFVVTQKNEHELSKLPDFARALGVNYTTPNLSLNLRFLGLSKKLVPLGLDQAEVERRITEKLKAWLPKDKRYVNAFYQRLLGAEGKLPSSPKKLFACHDPYRSTYISWNSDVHLCCGSFSGADAVGNLKRDGFDNVWGGAAYQRARRLTAEMAMEDDDFICSRCPGRLL